MGCGQKVSFNIAEQGVVNEVSFSIIRKGYGLKSQFINS
jgi:hypothetical protein